MTYDILVLRALARRARTGLRLEIDAIALRAGGEPRDVRNAIRRLAKAGLVTRDLRDRAALTLAGLATVLAHGDARLRRRRVRAVRTASQAVAA